MTKAYTGPERRKYPRSNEKVAVLYRAAESSSLDYPSGVRNSVTRNISGGGMCFEAEVYVPPETIIEIQIDKPIDGGLKATLPIHATAKVVWVKQVETGNYKLGLQFVDISERHREKLIGKAAVCVRA